MGMRPRCMAGPEALLAGPEAQLDSWTARPAGLGGEGRADVPKDVQTIPQEFFPYRGRCLNKRGRGGRKRRRKFRRCQGKEEAGCVCVSVTFEYTKECYASSHEKRILETILLSSIDTQ